MNGALVLDLMRSAITVIMLVAGPLLLTALVTGVLVSVVQAVTQIQEQTLTFVPKLGAMLLVMFLGIPWLLRQLVGYLIDILQSIPTIAS